jgi:hypothetical protein
LAVGVVVGGADVDVSTPSDGSLHLPPLPSAPPHCCPSSSMEEQRTFNPLVQGSSPWGGTRFSLLDSDAHVGPLPWNHEKLLRSCYATGVFGSGPGTQPLRRDLPDVGLPEADWNSRVNAPSGVHACEPTERQTTLARSQCSGTDRDASCSDARCRAAAPRPEPACAWAHRSAFRSRSAAPRRTAPRASFSAIRSLERVTPRGDALATVVDAVSPTFVHVGSMLASGSSVGDRRHA